MAHYRAAVVLYRRVRGTPYRPVSGRLYGGGAVHRTSYSTVHYLLNEKHSKDPSYITLLTLPSRPEFPIQCPDSMAYYVIWLPYRMCEPSAMADAQCMIRPPSMYEIQEVSYYIHLPRRSGVRVRSVVPPSCACACRLFLTIGLTPGHLSG